MPHSGSLYQRRGWYTVLDPICRTLKSLRRGTDKSFVVFIFEQWCEIQKAVPYHHPPFCSICLHNINDWKFKRYSRSLSFLPKVLFVTLNHAASLLICWNTHWNIWLWKISFYHYLLQREITILVVIKVTSVYLYF